jgi:hypothetical protein
MKLVKQHLSTKHEAVSSCTNPLKPLRAILQGAEIANSKANFGRNDPKILS